MTNLISAPAHHTSISEMTTEEFLQLLRERHVQVQARKGRLKVNAPAGTVDGLLRAELKARKAALLEALSEAMSETGANSEIVPLSRAELSGRIPLTPAQQGMWLIDHFNPGNVAYNIPEAFRLDQPIDLDTMQSAVDELIARHSILRTSVHEEDGELFQSIDATVESRVGFIDLSSLAEDERERSCRESIRSHGGEAFDMRQAPLVRFHLFRLAERRYVVFFNIHHIIADRTSLYVLREELVELIEAVENGRPSVLPALHLQFADYAAWVARQMRSDTIERQIAYWKRKLEGMPAFIELPHSRLRPEARDCKGATKRILVPEAVRSAMDRIGTAEGASPFMTFLAVFVVSVARWSQPVATGPMDFCIGSPITHRREASTQRMIGPLVNMLAFRCEIGPGMSFRDVVRQVRGTAIEAYENSDVPFQRMVGALNPDRSSRRSPIFQIMFGYETFQAPVANEFPMDADSGTARYDLSLHLWETALGSLEGAIEYCTDLFEEADIERLAACGDALMAEIVCDADHEVFGSGAATDGPGIKSVSPREPAGKADAPKAADRSGARGGLLLRTVRLLSSIAKGRSRHHGESKQA